LGVDLVFEILWKQFSAKLVEFNLIVTVKRPKLVPPACP